MRDDAPWEPSYADALVVGARVRVRLSGECHHCARLGRYGADSATAIITTVDRTFTAAHHYRVVFVPRLPYVADGPPPLPPSRLHATWLSAAELEPLDADEGEG